MSLQRTLDNSGDITVQPTVSTLHIPHTFIPFSQFSITDASGIRNPADDNNNKTALPVVSVVTAVSGLCPAISVVSMQQPAQIAQTVVGPTLIPAVVTPMTVQTANCLTPTTTMTVANTLNISSHISVPIQQQQTVGISGININPQSGIINNTPSALTNSQNTASAPTNKPTIATSSSIITGQATSSSTTTTNSTKSSINKSTSSSQSSSSEQNEDLVKPIFKDGELVLEVECGQNKAILYLSKLCQGSKGPCISFQNSWLTPNEFQFVSGRETAKDWKRSIRHHGKSLKLLLAKGILNVHPTMCDCDGCRQGATLTRKGEKRRIPNGERKARKPSNNSSGNLGGDGNSAGAFRPVGSATKAAQLPSPAATQVKPEVKRSAVDKSKMADTRIPSLPADVRGKFPSKPNNPQWSAGMNTPKDGNKQKTPKSTASPTDQVAILAPSHAATSTSQHQLNSPHLSATLNRAQTLLGSPNAVSSTASAPSSFLVASLPPTSSATPEEPRHASVSSLSASHIPTLPLVNAQPSHAHISPTTFNSHESQDDISNQEPDVSDDEDNMVENESDDSQHDDEIYDDSEDEQFDNCSKDSENSNIVSDNPVADSLSTMVNNSSDNDTNKTNEDITKTCTDQRESLDTSSKECPEVKKEVTGQQDSTDVPVSESSLPAAMMESKQKSTPEPELSPQPSLTATLGMSTFSGTFSQPLSVSTSMTNVKSEHIWVPPKLSPQGDGYHFQRTSIGAGLKSPTQVGSHDLGRDDHFVGFIQSKESEKNNIQGKPEKSPQGKDFGYASQRFESGSGVVPSRDFHSIEQHLTHNSENGVKDEPGQVRTGHGVNLEKQLREKEEKIAREREERHRQKIKEERSRKEREERNRKDREREERKERERKEEKETERRRQEEKDRREMTKAQAESNPNKDRSTGTPTMDPSRRPPGGVAEAAAFSDYMRVLAAGHGHTFMPPTMSYLPSLFPIRPQESSIPTHLLHPMSAFGHQLSGLSKDPMLYHPASGVLTNYGASQFGPIHPLLQRPQYTSHQSLLEYQRSLSAAASAYQWPAAYPYFFHDVSAASSSSSSASTAAALAAGVKRPTTEIEAAMELTTKRMRLDGRPPEYTSPWDYFAAAAAASQQQRVPTMAASLPCGLESASMDKTAEYLRKRYMEYGPQAAAYLSALPEHARPAYYCACADHRDDNIRMWNVEDVCKFLNSLDGCAVYSDHFREQRVTGRILAILTTDHLVKTMGMKLGPAVLLAEAVAKKLQDSSKMSSCEACRSIALSQPMHPMALPL